MATISFSRSHVSTPVVDMAAIRSIAFYIAISAIAIAVAVPAAIATMS
jgi:hypothetical protein